MLFNDTLDGLMVECKGLTEPEAVRAMRNACIEFCQKTYALNTGTEIVVNGTEVPAVDMAAAVVDIIEVRIPDKRVLVTHPNDRRVAKIVAGDLDYDYVVTYVDPNNPQLLASPSATAPSVATPITMELMLAIAPGPSSNEIDDFIWQRYSEALESGALSRLMKQPGKPWTNGDAAVMHRQIFDAAIDDASSFAARNRQQTAHRIRMTPADTPED